MEFFLLFLPFFFDFSHFSKIFNIFFYRFLKFYIFFLFLSLLKNFNIFLCFISYKYPSSDSQELELEILAIRSYESEYGKSELSLSEEFIFYLSEISSFQIFLQVFLAKITFTDKVDRIKSDFETIDHG